MKTFTFCFFLFMIFLFPYNAQDSSPSTKKTVLVIHGGAGTIKRSDMTPEMEKAHRQALKKALKVGHQILEKGGSSLDAVEATICILEDSPLFNAGKGAVFNSTGQNELDASIMDGKSLNAGSVAAVKEIKNPIKLARLVMEKSSHVMLSGEGAETFAQEQGLEKVDPSYFHTERRWKRYQKTIKQNKDSSSKDSKKQKKRENKKEKKEKKEKKHGTVGAVALDQYGNLAAGTSTGGMHFKRFGRIGDSPIIGAGTYANNETCAVSATGYGEYFIRLSVAHHISAMMEYKKASVQEAAEEVILKKLIQLGGSGGVIAVDSQGNIAMPFTSSGMYRGYVRSGESPHVFIYKTEKKSEKKSEKSNASSSK